MVTAPEKPVDGVLTLTSASFGSNIVVKDNSGGYDFSIKSGTYTEKKFTGSSSSERITNAGAKISISAGAGNDYITSSGKNVTIVGDAGNDSLWGGKGADVFICHDSDTGTDIIFDYDFSVDKIVATCSEFEVYADGLDLCYKFTNSSLILKNALAQNKNQ